MEYDGEVDREVTEKVIIVPYEYRAELLQKWRVAVLQGYEEDTWVVPSEDIRNSLRLFLTGNYLNAPQKSWAFAEGSRIGYTTSGYYLHADHCKRFFGLRRKSASPLLAGAFPELEVDQRGQSSGAQGSNHDSTNSLLNKLARKMPSVSDDLRHEVLRATFRSADSNGNGTLSRPELGTLMRRMLGTLSAQAVEDYMKEAEIDEKAGLSYEEFAEWLHTSNNEISSKLRSAMSTQADIVKASFRVWDTNGDGLISKKEFFRVMHGLDKSWTEEKINVLMHTMDTHRDGSVDYDEFVQYLYGGH